MKSDSADDGSPKRHCPSINTVTVVALVLVAAIMLWAIAARGRDNIGHDTPCGWDVGCVKSVP